MFRTLGHDAGMKRDLGTGMDLLGIVLIFGAPAYIILQILSLIVARFEGWRIPFALPLVLAVPIAAWCLFALAQDSNLWPLPFILFAPFGAAYLLVVLSLRAILAQRT